jgi:hypothetical protein
MNGVVGTINARIFFLQSPSGASAKQKLQHKKKEITKSLRNIQQPLPKTNEILGETDWFGQQTANEQKMALW